MLTNKLEITFASELLNVKSVLSETLSFITLNIPRLENEEALDLKLIFSELLCNSVLHGNKSDIKKRVSLSVKIEDGTVFASISDEGEGFDYNKILSLSEGEDPSESDHGRGIRLVYAMTDSLLFNESGNVINFVKKVRADDKNSCG